MWLLYEIATALALLLGAPFFLLARGRHYLETVPGRLGGWNGTAPERPVWIHAVSVGEVGVAATLIEELPPEVPLLVTTVTPTGQRRAREVLGDRAAIAYLPFDLSFAIERFMRRFRPRALLLAEGDYWPLILRRTRREGLSIQVFNGRVSDRGFGRMKHLRSLLGATLGRVDRFSVQTADDAARLRALGVPEDKVAVTGNLKYESPQPATHPELESRLRDLAGERPLLLAGSTMPGEEEQVLEAFRALGGGSRALLLIAPRHPERWPEVARLLEKGVARFAARSDLPTNGRPDAILLDSLGELAGLYRVADASFVGGTLTGTGGHNPLEPARFGVPVAVGPSMENFRQIAEEFDRFEAWARVRNAAELGQSWSAWLERPEEAREVGARGLARVEANRGALEKTLRELAAVLPEIGAAT